MRRSDICLYLGPADSAELEALVTNRNTPRRLVWRAGIVLGTADWHVEADGLVLAAAVSQRWVPGLKRDRRRPSRVPPLPMETRLNVIAKTVQESPPNATTGAVP